MFTAPASAFPGATHGGISVPGMRGHGDAPVVRAIRSENNPSITIDSVAAEQHREPTASASSQPNPSEVVDPQEI